MTSDAAAESQHVEETQLILLGSPSVASDTGNAIDDRIFFGPLQSPEKQLSAPMSGPKFRTPVRRSTRLSSATMLLPKSTEEGISGLPSTREETPEEDMIPDEPSIVLASRVLSACSNPSPPPSPTFPPQNMLEPDDFDIATPEALNASASLLGPSLIPHDSPTPSSSPFMPHDSTPTHQHSNEANYSPSDLTAFDPVSIFNPSHLSAAPSGSIPSCDNLAQSIPESVDDLLSISPSYQGIDPHAGISLEQRALKGTSPTPINVTVVAHSELAHPHPSTPPKMPLSDNAPPDIYEYIPEKEFSELELDSETPPVRRSRQPRKSQISVPQSSVAASLQPVEHEDSSAGSSDGQRHNAQRKRRLKPSPCPEDTEEGASIANPNTPRRLPQVTQVHKELGPLSPVSSAVLSRLVPSAAAENTGESCTSSSLPPQQDASSKPIAPKTPPHQIPSFNFPSAGPSAGPEASNQRPKSPLRPFSPFKFGESSRSPARRIPIAQAFAEGSLSPNKLPAAFSAARFAPGAPVFRKLALDDPMRSPAKRVPLVEAAPVPPPSPGKNIAKDKSKITTRALSPTRSSSVPPQVGVAPNNPPSLARGPSAEPFLKPPALGRRSLFKKPTSLDDIPSSVKPRSVLPFPLQQHGVPSIPEGNESMGSPTRTHPVGVNGAGALTPFAIPLASPAKQGSSLRQPSAGSGSKIPRIGAKPYARPKTEVKVKPPMTPKDGSASRAHPIRVVHIGSSSGSSSDEATGPSNVPAVVIPALKPRRAFGTQSTAVEKDSVKATGSKRKREAEVSIAKAPAGQQKIIMRKVFPGMFNKGKEAVASTTGEQVAPARSSPAKISGPIKARSAVGWKRPQQESSQPPPSVAVPVERPTPHKEPISGPGPPPATATGNSAELWTHPGKPRPTAPLIADEANEASSRAPSVSTEAAEVVIEQISTRRSTRPKRNTTPSADVFGSVISTRPPPRRRGLLPSQTNGPFAGMSALALKTLTCANTKRNQEQVVKIETEIIRKEGTRPDSPTTRVRSSLEKQKEERLQRAARRARRSAGSDILEELPSLTGDREQNGAEVGDVSTMSVDEEGLPLRHRRGPGDEEDYETPPRPERPIKRPRFEGEPNKDAMEERTKEEDIPVKRVKWNKGLQTTVFLADTPPKPKWDTKAAPSSKGCLTPAAKALRLDTLGNVLNAEIPVSGLVVEHIVVKKFVFDDDDVEGTAPPTTAPAAKVKSTRSKNKKSKS